MISKEEMLEYIESATAPKTKQLALVMCNMMTEQQVNTLSSRFTKKIDFQLKEPKKEEEPPEEQEPDPMAGIDLD